MLAIGVGVVALKAGWDPLRVFAWWERWLEMAMVELERWILFQSGVPIR